MKKILLCATLVLAGFQACAAGLEWFTDAEAAQQKAKQENKFVLLFFTESDFCGTCAKFKSEIFDQPEFGAFADANLVMMMVDFPHDKPQNPETKRINQQLATVLSVDTFPTVIVLDQNGHFAAHGVYAEGGARPYIADLEKIAGMKHVDLDAAVAEAPPPPSKPVVFVPIPPAPPVYYDALALKAITGGKDRRIATINNETFMAGEAAKVKVMDERVEVVCKEIRDDSVLITANGKLMELKLGKH